MINSAFNSSEFQRTLLDRRAHTLPTINEVSDSPARVLSEDKQVFHD